MKRPDGIKLVTALMAIAVFLHLVAVLASPLPMLLSESHGLIRFSLTVAAAAIIGVLMVLLESLVLWFFWRGLSWARWIVIAGCLLAFVSLRHFFGGPVVSRGHGLIILYRMAIAAFILIYLSMPPARRWFAHLSKRHQP